MAIECKKQLRTDFPLMEEMDMPATTNLRASAWTLSDFPEVGDVLENCRLIASLGHGGSGRAFLAQQSALADRYIVLKVSMGDHDEHLNLARLQQTHIMPLYWASTIPYNGLRVLAMPYLAKTTLSGLLKRLQATPIKAWDGARVFAELQRDQETLPVRIPPREHAAQILKQSSWVDFVLRLGQTVAEALALAHERRLLHLDVKPSNILITPDGQPILLDLDVARPPIAAGTANVPWFGGTPAYMSPEQRQAMEALSLQQPIPVRIDERSDVYSLGMVLYLALGGTRNDNQRPDVRRLPRRNPQVSREVMDILARCVAERPADRYPSCSALAADLERQLNNLPLCGVRDRWSDRCRKWRRRRPLGVPMMVLFACFCVAASFAGFCFQQIMVERRTQAETALLDGQDLQRRRHYDAAIHRFSAGKEAAARTFHAGFLHEQLSHRLCNAQRLQYAQKLKRTVRLMRFYAVEEHPSPRMQHVLEAAGRIVWARRAFLTDRSAGAMDQAVEQNIDHQLQELLLLWSDMQMRLAPPTHAALVRAQVHEVIDQAEQLFGPCFAVRLAQEQYGIKRSTEPLNPKLAWEFCSLGRIALTRSDLNQAEERIRQAFALDPLDPVTSFYAGILALQQKNYPEALQAFSFCLGNDSDPECFVLRGQAYAALAQDERALRDFQQAIDRKTDCAFAHYQRGQLYERMGRPKEARADLDRAKQLSE